MLWLDAKYAAQLSSQLDLFKSVKPNVWNFRCPICGDSKKDRTKARGYLYPYKQTLRFRCHNCGASHSFYEFLSHQDPIMFKEYKLERYREKKSQDKVISVERRQTRKLNTKLTETDNTLFGMPAISSLPTKHMATKYVASRQIPKNRWSSIYYVDRMEDVAKKFPEYRETRFDDFPRIVLPFINRDGVVTHIQGRAIGTYDVPKSKRYITLEIEDEPKIFGLSDVDENSTVFVVEGPIDSLFLPNSVGMGGSDVDYTLFDIENTTFIFDNEPRNREVVKRMAYVVGLHFAVCIWGEEVKEKDINDMILSGMDTQELVDYIKSHTYRGLQARLELTNFKKCSL